MISPKIKIIKSTHGGYLEVSPQKNWLIIIIMSLWLCGWAVGEIKIFALVSGMIDMGEISSFVIVLSTFWTWAGLHAIRLLIYLFFGKEIIEFKNGLLILDKKMAWILTPKTFDLSQATCFEVNTTRKAGHTTRAHNYKMALGKAGRIRFQYQGKAIFMANVANDEEAKAILALMCNHEFIQETQLGSIFNKPQ